MIFGTRIKELIKERNLKQNQVAKELHIAPSTLNGYITEERQPDYTILIRIADYLEVSVDYLLGVTNIRTKPGEPMSLQEGELVGIYRSLESDKQDLLMEQAHLYHRMDLDKREQKKNG